MGRKLSCLRVRRLDTLISPLSDNNNGDQEREARGERGFGPKRCFAAATLASIYLVGFGPDGLEGREGGEAFCSRRRGERQIGGGGGKMEPNLASDVAQKATGLRQQGLRSSAPQMSKFSSNHFVVFSTTALGF